MMMEIKEKRKSAMQRKKDLEKEERAKASAVKQTQTAIKFIKDHFERELSKALNLSRVSAPRFLQQGTGLQDDLAGSQIPVQFKAKALATLIEMVHSLAKWKRYALKKYNFTIGSGLYTDMDAVRKDETLDALHSIYVDQWDWEKAISKKERNLAYLKKTVEKIYDAIGITQKKLKKELGLALPPLPKTITFIHSLDAQKAYPDKSPKEREDLLTKKYGAVFLIGIGSPLADGKPHDTRAFDYDDWTTMVKGKPGLNGDILVWHEPLKTTLELSSMGIRVDKKALLLQAKLTGNMESLKLPFHKAVLEHTVPLSIGGGIGQSRLCMYLLQKRHIGEVQCSVWPDRMVEECKSQGIILL
ncbi:MAG: aspartate--ammonia ligase [Candidatus Woesearchaeota archaeon]